MDFNIEYKELLRNVENKLSKLVKGNKPEILYSPMAYILQSGGKRIRPVLAMIACGAAGGKPGDALNPACAIEILHNFTLAHDDIMDRSPLRRGRKTLHEKWNDAVAILTGDVMIGYAYSLLVTPQTNQRAGQIQEAFTCGLIEVCEGQALDMEFNKKHDVTLDDYFQMISKKTSAIIEMSAVIGGHCANAEKDVIDALQNYAYSLGIAFQLQDDLLDITAEQAELGKNIGQDLVEGKKTLLVIKAKAMAQSNHDRNLIDFFYGNGGIEQSEVPNMREMMERLGVFEQTQMLIDKYLRDALFVLDDVPSGRYRDMLIWLVNLLNCRKS